MRPISFAAVLPVVPTLHLAPAGLLQLFSALPFVPDSHYKVGEKLRAVPMLQRDVACFDISPLD